jgi:signal-transduction protein with cAMP-binding, CBS, and nucleotidyltransferase domain
LGSDLNEIMVEMTRSRIRHLPVVEEGQLSGIISIGDVVKNRLDELETETSVLRDYIVGRA